MKQFFIKVMGVLLLVALAGCMTPSSGGYGNRSGGGSSSGHSH